LFSVVVAALSQVLLGVKGLSAPTPEIWGVPIEGPAKRLRGTFVNPNHAALYLEMSAAAVFAWGWWALRHARGSLSPDRRLLHFLPAFLVWGAIAAAVLLTGSRAGLVALLVGLAVQLVLVLKPRRQAGRALLTAVLVAGALALALSATWILGAGRWEMASLYEDNLRARIDMTSPALSLWLRFPVTGSGLGSFAEAFSMVDLASPLRAAWTRAHNDPLELLVTGGLVGVSLLLVAFVSLVRRLAHVLSWGGRTENRAAALAALGMVASVSVHELFDFGLTVPANAVTFAALVGLAAGVPTGVSREREVATGGRVTSKRPRSAADR
jgi:O-antigen ligase